MKTEVLNLELLEKSLISVLDCILERYQGHPDYHFIDTKLDIITGEDFPERNTLFGRQTIFSWIQGRGLEALAGHYNWINKDVSNSQSFKDEYSLKIKTVLVDVLAKTSNIYSLNDGHMPFMVDTSGLPVCPTDDNSVESFKPDISTDSMTLSDLFYIKGMAAAAAVLGETKLYEKAEIDFDKVIKSLFENKFVFDQLSFDVKNQIAKQSDGILQGGFMIALGGCSTFMNTSLNKAKYYEYAIKLIDYILKNHVNVELQIPGLKQYEMWELSDNQGSPILEDGVLKSDPGHALEFVGLALKALFSAKENGLISEIPRRYIDIFSNMLIVNFKNGFSKDGYGIVKSFDLCKHQVINSDMPWWSLPETMRSCALAYKITNNEDFMNILVECHKAFVLYYQKSDVYDMAVQTVNKFGQPISVIPATPDADPGYHTGLSIIEVIKLVR
jgi:mannose/cellobiose epimerase-like protein (N-acyl-D-glucosamine 2-epimerase family)